MAAPPYVGHGGGFVLTTTAVPQWPATVSAGDLGVMYASTDSSTFPDIAGWTKYGPVTAGGLSHLTYVATTQCSGSEDGTVVSVSGFTGGTQGVIGIVTYAPATVGNVLAAVAANSGSDGDTSSTSFSAAGSSWTVNTDDRIVVP